MLYMETPTRTQTAFRLKDSLLESLKWNSKRAHKSMNAFVEEILEEALQENPVFPQVSPSFLQEQRKATERFVLKDATLPETYQNLDEYNQTALDKKLLADARYEKYR